MDVNTSSDFTATAAGGRSFTGDRPAIAVKSVPQIIHRNDVHCQHIPGAPVQSADLHLYCREYPPTVGTTTASILVIVITRE